ncbi:MAG: gliding motility-associated C-terminal domain-containing protein, partial [Saprospiraceae bacterium]|nr:gliding motility-associated C-terminal domain-containing protein [Saprospiraceae bacterium]
LCAGNYVVTITTGDGIIILDTIRLTEPPSLSVSANITDAMEGGDGAINLSVSGGTPPYGVQWNDPGMSVTQNLSGLDAGEYSVTITDDNGCTYTAGPFEVRDGGAIAADVTDVACFGDMTGEIVITNVNCGPGPFTYLWSTDATTESIADLVAGSYAVTVTASDGTTCETSFTVDGPDSAIEVAIDTTNETSAGNDGSIDLTVSGGVSPYTFLWDNNAMTEDLSGLAAGSYTVTITDQFGCEVVETILIRGNEMFVELMISDFNTYGVSCAGECDGELIAASVNGVGNLSYSWSNGETTQSLVGLCAGSYTVTVTDEIGQTAVATAEVTEPPALALSVEVMDALEPGSSDGSATAVVSGGVPPYSYQWHNGSNSASIQAQPPGSIVVFVTDDNNCEVMQQASIGIRGIPCYSAISVITPNGDGKNDQFVVQCVFDLPNRLMIFNRYGGLEFEMDNYDNSWEGTDNDGEVLSDGGYHWVLEVFLNNGDTRVYRGTVALVRSLD